MNNIFEIVNGQNAGNSFLNITAIVFYQRITQAIAVASIHYQNKRINMLFAKGWNKWILIGTIHKIESGSTPERNLYVFEQKSGNIHYASYHRLGPRYDGQCEYKLVCPD
jgi:hypothetical protein